MREIDLFYLRKQEPVKSCLLFLRTHIPAYNKHITEAWKYNMPFFCYKGKMFCYLWVDPKIKQPYIGFVEGRKMEHPLLIAGNRSRMKIMQLDSNTDVPVKALDTILQMAIDICDSLAF
ncbi:DUF1801 domain-containing protein [Mucilaginibacter sp.]|uniref:DUF1801 domain-containing protein n=1 Tax=Mucilaginibacter sp. TaxID=1882438 RepID=UPI003D0F9E5E